MLLNQTELEIPINLLVYQPVGTTIIDQFFKSAIFVSVYIDPIIYIIVHFSLFYIHNAV